MDTSRLYIKLVMLLPALSLLFLIPVPSFADTTGSIAVTLVYTNEDTADYWPVSLTIYQDSSQTPYKAIESLTGNPFNIVSLPIGHQYKIVAYANSMYSSVGYVDLEQPQQAITIKLPLPGGMRINAFYNDGVTPIANATVYIRASLDNKTWGHSITNVDGDSLRFWIEPTTSTGDHYIVDVHIGNHLVYSASPVYLRPGISQEIKITTNWPPIVNSLVTVNVLDSQSHPVSTTDGKFSVDLFDSNGNTVSNSPVTSRGVATFSNIKVGDYTFKVTKIGDNSTWASASMTEDGTNTIFQVMQSQNTTGTATVTSGQPTSLPTGTSVLPPTQIPNCNCVAFRLDNVQDYWLDDVQTKIIDSFDSKDAGITVGVIGKAFGNDSKLVNYLKSKTPDGNIDVAINGWSFEDFTTFTKDQQSGLLEQSKAKMSSLLGITPTVFLPPYEKTNSDTLYAMASNGIGIISGSPVLNIPQNLTGTIHNYPANVFAGVLAQNTNQSMLNDKILSSVNDAIKTNGYAVVILNFQDYAQGNASAKTNIPDIEKIQNLQLLIDTIRNNGYRITTIGNMENMFKQAPWASSVFQWSQDKISSAEFLGIVKSIVPSTANYTTIPSWVKSTAKLQSQGLISEDEFTAAMQYLVQIQAIK
ncbi:MAG: polysaccharide deacetylase family protein [Thaumarchaeota archaeon]|nr:polysaccharide deacetylase family protein [Nitrososphaerota archaeon]MDE1818173.1 polysaccharide deacetylase family protein [Nitrososphaerota archaeon]MDE1876391.1 polysaccharide deacetylase family protein [Nitrososphaerota archaeon]